MKALAEQINDVDGVNIYGRVVGVRGLMVEIAGPIHAMSVGARIVIELPFQISRSAKSPTQELRRLRQFRPMGSTSSA